MQFICSLCRAKFKSLKKFYDHAKVHGFKTCEDGIDFVVRETIKEFYPTACPHCKSLMGWDDCISEKDIVNFIIKLREGI